MQYAARTTTAIAMGFLVALGWFAGTAQAQGNRKAAHVSVADKNFVMAVAEAGMTEIALGHVADARAGQVDVKQFGERMLTDHTQAGDELSAIATGQNIPLPADLSVQHQKVKAHLSTLSGSAFDRAFINQMVADHQGAVKLFQREIKIGTDPQLKAFAVKYLPTIRMHLKMAQDIWNGWHKTT